MTTKKQDKLNELQLEFWEIKKEQAHRFRIKKVACDSWNGIKSKASKLENKIIDLRDELGL